MDDRTTELYWNTLAYGIVAATALVIALAMYWRFPSLRGRWLPLPRLRPLKWSGHEVLLAFCVALGVQEFIVAALFQVGFFTPLLGPAPAIEPPDNPAFRSYIARSRIISGPLTLTLVLGVILLVMFARTGARPHHYGLSWARWPANIALGALGFVVATPVVLGVYWLAGLIFPPRTHPLAVFGQQNPEWWEWILIAFEATVAAPLREEIVMRGILQGWLARATLVGRLGLLTATLLFGILSGARYDENAQSYEFTIFPGVFAGVLAAGWGLALYRLARRFELSENEIQQWQPLASEPPLGAAAPELGSDWKRQVRASDENRSRRWAAANAWLAIYGSAMLFAVIHSTWPDPVPLFVFGLATGWLAYRTQSLIGPITLHALFNLSTFIVLYASVLHSQPAKGNAQTTASAPSAVVSAVPTSQLPLRK